MPLPSYLSHIWVSHLLMSFLCHILTGSVLHRSMSYVSVVLLIPVSCMCMFVELRWWHNWQGIQSRAGGWHWSTPSPCDETNGQEEDQAEIQDQGIYESVQLQSSNANTVSWLSQFVSVQYAQSYCQLSSENHANIMLTVFPLTEAGSHIQARSLIEARV